VSHPESALEHGGARPPPTIRLVSVDGAGRGLPRVYRMRASGYLFVAMTIAFTGIGLTQLLPHARAGAGGEALFAVGWFAILATFWFKILTSPFKVTIEPDGRVVLRSVLRSREVHASRIRSIASTRTDQGLSILHEGGRSLVVMPLDDPHDFVYTLRELNPRIDVMAF
jgi:hypothetical protein